MKINNGYLIVACLALMLCLMAILPEASHGDSLDDEISLLQMNARIDWGQVTAPIGKFLLIRKDNDVCALRFTAFHRGHDAKPATVFNSGEETFYAEYDWYYQKDGSGDFSRTAVRSGHNKLVRKPLRGIGRLAFQKGEIYVKCGPFKLYWGYPTLVSFFGVPKQGDYGVEMTPTKWTTLNEIKVTDSHLKWYRCDQKRKKIYIPMDKL